MKHRRAIFLAEMGLGPQWLLRDAPAASVEAAVEPMAEAAPVPASAKEAAPVSAPQDDGQRFAGTMTPPAWPTLQSAVAACTACTRSTERKQAILGSGDRRARWLFVAGAPDAEEDAQGAPLVAAAGRLFDNMLAAMGLRLGENVFLTHAVKCHGSAPAADSVEACRVHLAQQIALLQPAVIVALGAEAAAALAPAGAQRGQALRHGEIPLVLTHAPATLLRTPSAKAEAWADLCLAMDHDAAAA